MIQQSLAAIDRGVNRMNVMIQDLVDVTRWEGGQLELKREAVDLPRYLDDLLQRVSTALETPRIQVEMPADLPPVSADYARLERILVNLLSNALKYSDPGTPVRLRARQEEGQVVVAVSDQGRRHSRGGPCRISSSVSTGLPGRAKRKASAWAYISRVCWWKPMAGASGWRAKSAKGARSTSPCRS